MCHKCNDRKSWSILDKNQSDKCPNCGGNHGSWNGNIVTCVDLQNGFSRGLNDNK